MKNNSSTKKARRASVALGKMTSAGKSKYAEKKARQAEGNYSDGSPFKPEIAEDDYTGHEPFNNLNS